MEVHLEINIPILTSNEDKGKGPIRVTMTEASLEMIHSFQEVFLI